MTASLSRPARAALRAAGIPVAEYSARFWSDARWHGAACGCPDDRCGGHHHEPDDACGCLAALIADHRDGSRP